jgi:protein-disulfide isomerase
MHEWAKPAAVAAECAGRQGKFWDYHDRLYDKQEEWTNAKADGFLTGYAKDLGLDVPAWQACRQDPAVAAAYAADMKDGDDAWVGATPTFFINGRRFVGAVQLRELGTLFMDRELKK